ncbi:unnamed protein product [Clavelina lepadiformis]|uniref:Uncharacterized protein n=1 Tax=Clavelina lepadiformis TaxID=159417 RepID=A0ABP0FMS9_CLALP
MSHDEALRDKLFDLYACVGEGKDSSIATKAAEHFPTTIQLPQPMNSNLVPGFLYVMKHVTKQLDVLGLWFCSVGANSFHEIASVIKEMKPGQRLLRVVRDELWMWNCFIGDDGWRRHANQDEINQLQSAFNKIQTRLKVHVNFGFILRSQK